MATIKSYTDLEQSKKLAKILPIETADMFLAINGTIPMVSKYIDDGFITADNTAVPCWSLSALLGVLPLPDLIQDKADDELFWQCSVYDENGTLLCETYDNNPVDACVEMIEKLHEQKGYQITTSTELKESEDSEDEKTRTKLLNLLKELLELGGVAQDTWSMNDCERFIAWLEKQGEQTEAQAENNLPSFDEAQGTIIVEKQGGQKSTDKVEPKFNFKVRQWIVATGKCVYLIAKIDGFNVTLVDTNGDEYVFDASLLNDAYQWTIQDAKDGDVLCYKDEISLYKHDIKNCTKQGTTFGGFVYHCCYDGKRFITDSLYSLTEQDKMDIHPATKEQRSLLFQKMREAGYEWDDEKKVLKKIEGEFNGEDYGIDSLWHAQNILERTLGKVDGYQSDDGILEHKCAITAVKKLYKQKSVEWSWMDKQHLSSIIKMVEHCSFSSIGGITKAAAVDWLKFLKDRIQPQPKQ